MTDRQLRQRSSHIPLNNQGRFLVRLDVRREEIYWLAELGDGDIGLGVRRLVHHFGPLGTAAERVKAGSQAKPGEP